MADKKSEAGAVTAELVMAMPTAVLFVVVVLAAGGWQLQQQRLVAVAATAARAQARGESPTVIDSWLQQIGAKAKISYTQDLVCAEVTQKFGLSAFASLGLPTVSEQQCTPKQ